MGTYSDERAQEFVKSAGRHVFVGPALCFAGLVEALAVPPSTSVALVAESEAALREAAAGVEGTGRSLGPFPEQCVD